MHLYLPYALESSLERKSGYCPDPNCNGRVDKSTNLEYPDKIVAIELDQIA